MVLPAEISEPPRIDCAMGLLLAILMQIYNEKEQAEHGKMQNVEFEEKKKEHGWYRREVRENQEQKEIA